MRIPTIRGLFLLKITVLLLLAEVVVLTLFSCSSAPPAFENHEESTRITIHEPNGDHIYHDDDLLNLKVTFENNSSVRHIDVSIVNVTSGDTVYCASRDPHADYFYFLSELVHLHAAHPATFKITASCSDARHPERGMRRIIYFHSH